MKLFLYIMLIIAIIVILYFVYTLIFHITRTKIEYSESQDKVYSVKRGFYSQVSSDNLGYIDIIPDGIDVILVTYDIGEFSDIEISESKLLELELMLNKLRRSKKSVVFRAGYKFLDMHSEPLDDDEIFDHVKQISPVLNEYKDIIICVQAGFVGLWGEWHGTSFFSGGSEEIESRNALISELLNNLDNEIIVNIRRPRFIRDYIAAGFDASRLGVHNDAIFGSYNDLGTYDDPDFTREEELVWLSENIITGANGGEAPYVTEYTEIDNVIKEMRMLKLTYLNIYYNIEVLDYWRSIDYKDQNAYDYISNHLGYRFFIDYADLPKQIRLKRIFEATINIKNSGFAPIGPGHSLYFIIKQDGKVIFNEKMQGDVGSIYNDSSKPFTIDSRMNLILDETNSEDLLLGIYIQKNSYNGKSINSKIELANNSIFYTGGVNYFARYIFDGKRYVLNALLEE